MQGYFSRLMTAVNKFHLSFAIAKLLYGAYFDLIRMLRLATISPDTLSGLLLSSATIAALESNESRDASRTSPISRRHVRR